MRILLQALVRLVDTNQLQQFPGTFIGLLLGFVGMQKNNFPDLISDGIDRVKTGHRVLKDNRNFIPPDLTHLPFRHLIDMMSIEIDIPANQPTRMSRQAHKAV